MSMTLNGTSFSNDTAPTWKNEQAFQNDPEKLKETLKDKNTSAEQFSHALGRLNDIYGQKVQQNTASDEEKELSELIKNVFAGKSSNADLDRLGSLLGVDPAFLADVRARNHPHMDMGKI